MKKEVEIEYKSIIEKEKYEELISYFDSIAEKKEKYIQNNYYFDTENNILNKLGVTLRIRNKSGDWEKTLKLPSKDENKKYSKSIEINEPIDIDKAKSLIEKGFEIKDEFLSKIFKEMGFEDKQLNCIGELKTERIDFNFYEDVISLDKNYYNDIVDYELEWETKNHKFVNKTLSDINVIPNNGKGKRKRFIKTIKK